MNGSRFRANACGDAESDRRGNEWSRGNWRGEKAGSLRHTDLIPNTTDAVYRYRQVPSEGLGE